MAKTVEVPVVGAPQKLAYQFLSLVSYDWVVLFVGICMLYIGPQLLHGVKGFLAVLVLFGWLLWPLNNGRRYYVLAMDVYGYLWINKVLNGIIFPVDPKQRPDLKGWQRLLVRMFIPPEHLWLRVDSLYNAGVIHVPFLGTDSVIVSGEGSDFSRLSPVEQGQRLDSLGQTMATFARLKGLRARVALVARRRPSDPLEAEVQYLQNLTVGAYLPKALEVLHTKGLAVTVESISELHEAGELTDDDLVDWNHYIVAQQGMQAAARGTSLDLVAVLTVRRSQRIKQAARRHKRRPLSEEEAGNEDLIKLANRFMGKLRSIGVDSPRVLTRSETEDYVRAGLDVVELNNYRSARVGDLTVPYGPEGQVTAGKHTVQYFGTHHMTFRLTGLPEGIAPDTMGALFSNLPTQSYLTRVMTSEIVMGGKEYHGLGTALNLIRDLLEAFDWFRTGPRTERRLEKLQQEQKLVDDQRHINYCNILLSLSHPDPKVIEADVDTINNVMFGLGMSMERIEGWAWTPRAALSCLGPALF